MRVFWDGRYLYSKSFLSSARFLLWHILPELLQQSLVGKAKLPLLLQTLGITQTRHNPPLFHLCLQTESLALLLPIDQLPGVGIIGPELISRLMMALPEPQLGKGLTLLQLQAVETGVEITKVTQCPFLLWLGIEQVRIAGQQLRMRLSLNTFKAQIGCCQALQCTKGIVQRLLYRIHLQEVLCQIVKEPLEGLALQTLSQFLLLAQRTHLDVRQVRHVGIELVLVLVQPDLSNASVVLQRKWR